MIDSGFDNCTKLDNFLRASKGLAFSGGNKKEKYNWIKETLNKVSFRNLVKKERGIVREYIGKITSYSPAQISRLIANYLEGRLFLREYQRHKFVTKFTISDVALSYSDNEYANIMEIEKAKLFEKIGMSPVVC